MENQKIIKSILDNVEFSVGKQKSDIDIVRIHENKLRLFRGTEIFTLTQKDLKSIALFMLEECFLTAAEEVEKKKGYKHDSRICMLVAQQTLKETLDEKLIKKVAAMHFEEQLKSS